jgi:DNA-binding MarR family transcriptional regulator
MSCHTPQGTVLTGLILETFRLNGLLLAAGDRLTSDLGLSSARWQVMGAIDEAPLPVAQIARNMGLTRQAVQRVANVLADEGLVEFTENPDHRRAKLVRLAAGGRVALEKISGRQIEWSNRLAEGLDAEEIKDALAVLSVLRQRLEAGKS